MIPYEMLAGRSLVLEPLEPRHTPDLINAALVGQSIFESLRTVRLHNEQEVRDWVSGSIEKAREHDTYPYAIIDVQSGVAVGAIWYLHVNERHRRCKVGWAWLAPRFRTVEAELEAKLIMVEHALEECDMDRVEFRIDAGDEAAQRALERFGATPEGILRDDYVTIDGEVRDTLVFSVLATEWTALRERLEERIGAITDADRAAARKVATASIASHAVELPLPRE